MRKGCRFPSCGYIQKRSIHTRFLMLQFLWSVRRLCLTAVSRISDNRGQESMHVGASSADLLFLRHRYLCLLRVVTGTAYFQWQGRIRSAYVNNESLLFGSTYMLIIKRCTDVSYICYHATCQPAVSQL